MLLPAQGTGKEISLSPLEAASGMMATVPFFLKVLGVQAAWREMQILH